MNFTIQRCGSAEYSQMLVMLNTAFGHSGETWFEENLSNCTPFEKDAQANEIANHFIAVSEHQVIGAVGAYPVDWAVSFGDKKYAVNAYGIGQVSCLPEYRNRGVMTGLLNAAASEMSARGCTVSFLGGDRWRYSHFGYDFGGNCAEFYFSQNRLGKSPDSHLSVCDRIANKNDIPLLNSMYEQLPSYTKRDTHTWEKQMKRKDVTFLIGLQEEQTAYICIKNKKCAECSGNPKGIISLLYAYMKKHEVSDIRVCYPFADDAAAQTLHQYCSWLNVSAYGLVAFHNADALFEQFTPAVKEQLGSGIYNLNAEQRISVLRGLFGYLYNPQKTINLKPLCAWIAPLDHI